MLPAAETRGWQARLALGFAQADGRTRLVRRRHEGPLVVQRPFYPEGGVCHCYLLHPPGGVVGGDTLELSVEVGAAAHALVTTPAANKFYRSAGATAVQRQVLTVSEGAALEWLPQEQIVFAGAQVDSLTRVELAADARFIGWEISCLGRPASAAPFDHGALRQRLELWREGRPLVLERTRLDGADAWLATAAGLQGRPVLGTLLAVGADETLLEAVRETAPELAVTRLEDVLIARVLGEGGESARASLARAWAVLRPALLGRAACEPRIWRT